jgi:fructokinase
MTESSATPDDVILVGGEALYDLVLKGTDDLRGHPGGGPFNTARTISRLEQPVAYLGRVSTDRFGTRLLGALADDGVRLDAVVRTDDPTTLAIAEIDERGTRFRFYTDGTAAPGLTPQAARGALPSEVSILHVGTLGLVLEPMATALEAVVEALAGKALVALDPNCRPSIITDPEGYRGRLGRLLRHAHLIKVSDEDLAWLMPGEPAVAAARGLVRQGPKVALLTRGGEGAVVITRDAEILVPAPPVQVVDTIGAGDSFGGGFLAWWRSQGLGIDELADVETVVEATRFACAVAARTCERAGADPPRRAELELSPRPLGAPERRG